MLSDRAFCWNVDLDCQITRIFRLFQDPHEEPICESCTSHPADVLSAKIDFGDDAESLGQEGQCSLFALSDLDKFQWRPDAFYRA